MQKIILKVGGMTCSACSNGLEKYLNKQKGIQASVNLVMENVLVEYDGHVTIEEIEQYIETAGFKSLGVWQEQNENDNLKSEKQKWIVYTILIIVFFYISMSHRMGLPNIAILDVQQSLKTYTIVLFLMSILFLYYGKDILKSGYHNLIYKAPNMDTLVTIGIMSSFFYSLYSISQILKGNVTYVEQLYFESVGMIIYFIKLGRYIDSKSKNKTKEAIQNLVQMTPKYATVLKNGKETNVTIDSIQKGDILCVRRGEKIAVDGIITRGAAHIDEAFITGESKPVKKIEGNQVLAGSINDDGYLEYRAERIGAESTISEIVKLVVEATSTKAPIASLADKVSSYFVPSVLMIAFFTAIAYLWIGESFPDVLICFVTILVVACPCSLGLATPLAIVVAEGICAKNGILVKKSEILENACKVDTIVLDKTGTITYGIPKIESILLYGREESEVIRLAGSLEVKSSHPLGKAFITYMQEHQLKPYSIEVVQEMSGYGMVGNRGSCQILVGNAKLLKQFAIANPYQKEEEQLVQKGNSIVYVVENQTIVGLIGINDIVRKNTKEFIAELIRRKIEVMMLTGDHKNTALKIANQIGITDVIADVLPKDKASIVQTLKAEHKTVMMCGDGINDSPALVLADIGISFQGASDIASNSAGVILTHNDLYGILNLITISKNTIHNIQQNLFWAFFYNLLMIPIAMGLFRFIGVTMNPMFASIAMMFSSFTVVMNSLRLKRMKLK